WAQGYVMEVVVTNTSNSSMSGWSVEFTLPSGHQVVNNWNADFDTQGQSVTAENMSYNGNLGPGQSTQFGFQASRNGGSALPSTFTCSASWAGERSGPAGPPLGGPAGPSVGTGSAGWLRGEPGERAGDHLR